MASIGFGLERLGVAAARRWRTAAAVAVALTVAAIVGVQRAEFDDDLRNVFTGSAPAFATLESFRSVFTDPERELLVLVEGPELTSPAGLSALSDLHFELMLTDGVEDVFSLYSLRAPPMPGGQAPPLIAPEDGLDDRALAALRAHPMLGSKALTEDGGGALFAVTLADDLDAPRALRDVVARLKRLADAALAGTGLRASLTGFPVVREQIVNFILRDQVVLTSAGALVGFILSFIVFQSLVAAVMTALPAIVATIWVIGAMGLVGAPITVMSNVLPALVMMLAYTNCMHLTHAWCRRRMAREEPQAAACGAATEVGPATVLTALTTLIALLALAPADTLLVRNFALTGAVAILIGMLATISLHPLLSTVIGSRWRLPERPDTSFLDHHAWIAGGLVRFAVRRAWTVSGIGLALVVLFGALHISVLPEYSVREHLASHNPANAAFDRADRAFDGILPVHVVVPVEPGGQALSERSLASLREIHHAFAEIGEAGQTLSLWSLAQWGGLDDSEIAQGSLAPLLDRLSDAQRRRLIAEDGSAVVATTYVRDQPARLLRPLIERLEAAARAAAGDRIAVTGFAVVTAHETDRIISSLMVNLGLAMFMATALIAVAFRRLDHGLVSLLPNALPIVAMGAALYLVGWGMQYTSVIALTVALGVAADDTIHFLNRRRLVVEDGAPLDSTLGQVGRQVGTVLILTTVVLTFGLATTALSALPTVTLFGFLCMVTLVIALLSDLLLLPALIAGPGRHWFSGTQCKNVSSSTDAARKHPTSLR